MAANRDIRIGMGRLRAGGGAVLRRNAGAGANIAPFMPTPTVTLTPAERDELDVSMLVVLTADFSSMSRPAVITASLPASICAPCETMSRPALMIRSFPAERAVTRAAAPDC